VRRSPSIAAGGLVAIAAAIVYFVSGDDTSDVPPTAVELLTPPRPSPAPAAIERAATTPVVARAVDAAPAPRPAVERPALGGRSGTSLAATETPASELAGDTGADVSDAESRDREFAASYFTLAERFRTEPRSAIAAAVLERGIYDTLALQPGLAFTSIVVECRTSVCRVELGGGKGSDIAAVRFDDFATRVGTARLNPDGSRTREILLSRDAVSQN
jgi:hypothetical protein